MAVARQYMASALTVVRWWFGLVYLVAGIGGVVAGPVMIFRGNYGGVYMLIGGSVIGAPGS